MKRPSFEPSELNEFGERISPRDLGEWGDESILEPAWEALERAETADEFYWAVANLVFHSRHMHPTAHARLAAAIAKPFKRPANAPAKQARRDAILDALRPPTGLIQWSEWVHLSRAEIIANIQSRYGMTAEAARKQYDLVRKQLASERDLSDGKKG